MTSTAGCREIRQSLGVYVLGAIDPAERAMVDEHLATCLDCREELAALAGLPALLRKIPLSEAERIVAGGPGSDSAAPEELLQSFLTRAARVRQARRWRTLAAAAAVVLVAAGGGALTANALQPAGAPYQQPSGSTQVGTLAWQRVSGTARTTGVSLTVKYAKVPWGTEMQVHVAGVKPGTICEFQVTDASGAVWRVGSWQISGSDPGAWYPVATSIRDKSMRSFELTAGGHLLARVAAS
jgi:predicted anti-sigma-YlaC factor YlaD